VIIDGTVIRYRFLTVSKTHEQNKIVLVNLGKHITMVARYWSLHNLKFVEFHDFLNVHNKHSTVIVVPSTNI
jgi:hypothetical protein